MDILQDTNKPNVLDEDLVLEVQPKYKISHLVSANKLKVYLRIELLDREAEVKYEEILQYLNEQSIVYGIRNDDIMKFCAKKEYSKELIVACGKEPVNGKDAEVVYNFDISKEKKFEESSDGTIDFRNLNNIINVTKDTVLCYIVPPQKGEDGIDVYGENIRYKEGRNVSFNYGSNTYISNDGLKLLASTDGCVEIRNEKVFVESVYRVNNVDNSTGNIDFIGNVIINGDVKEGFSVSSKGDVKIKGMVEGAYISCDGDVVISKGMNGMGKGSIHAKGNVTSKYIENAKIVSQKSIYADALINSDVKAGESIILKGSTAAIIGGVSQAEKLIYAKTIGSKTNPETNIILDLTKYQEEQKQIAQKHKLNKELEKDLYFKNIDLQEIEEKGNLIGNSNLDDANKNSYMKQLLFKKIKVNNEINEIKKQLQEASITDNITDHRIICKGTIYCNTRICIGWMKYRVRQDISYSKVYNDGNDISIIPLNPGDLEL
jgi:hypothetical protein